MLGHFSHYKHYQVNDMKHPDTHQIHGRCGYIRDINTGYMYMYVEIGLDMEVMTLIF